MIIYNITRLDKFLEVPTQNIMFGHMIWEGLGDGCILGSRYAEHNVWSYDMGGGGLK